MGDYFYRIQKQVGKQTKFSTVNLEQYEYLHLDDENSENCRILGETNFFMKKSQSK